MHEFVLERPRSTKEAVRRAKEATRPMFLAGGTTLVDLMKLGVLEPQTLLELSGLRDELGD
ncbi:MAG: xanthine dehydrogenase family protein subunit M, partial [Myxococcota bacterium]